MPDYVAIITEHQVGFVSKQRLQARTQGGFGGFDRTPLNSTNQSRALVSSSQSLYSSHYLTPRAHVVKQNGPGRTITKCFRVTSSVKEPCTDTDDVESETNLPHTYRIFHTAFNLTMRIKERKN